MQILAGFADISLWQLALVAGVALFASIVGGVSGYGTGALMPLVLVPLVVPIIAISALFINSSRVTAFLRYADWRRSTRSPTTQHAAEIKNPGHEARG